MPRLKTSSGTTQDGHTRGLTSTRRREPATAVRLLNETSPGSCCELSLERPVRQRWLVGDVHVAWGL